MKIEQAIALYLDVRKARGLRLFAVDTLGRTLHTVFDSVLTEHIAVLTADQVAELRARLGRRGVRPDGPILGRRRDLHWGTSRRFLSWCVQQQLLTVDPLAPRKAKHIGELARQLREEAGLFRHALATQVRLSVPTLRQFETARRNLSREQLLQLLLHPTMARLPDKAQEAGLGQASIWAWATTASGNPESAKRPARVRREPKWNHRASPVMPSVCRPFRCRR